VHDRNLTLAMQTPVNSQHVRLCKNERFNGYIPGSSDWQRFSLKNMKPNFRHWRPGVDPGMGGPGPYPHDQK